MSGLRQPQMKQQRKAPGILRLLPETLPLYPFCQTDGRRLHTNPRKKKNIDVEDVAGSGERNMIPNEPLRMNNDVGFTLFFLVDSTNRHSLLALPKVSNWCHHALNCDGGESSGNRIICIPNHPSRKEISLRDINSDPILQASINSSVVTSVVAKHQILSMLLGTGFYHLPFLHPKRLPLLHLLGANRVPSVIVVSNQTGRIVTRYGWEAIDREGGHLEQWIERNLIESKKDSHDNGGCSTSHFESWIIKEWRSGKSGLPLWWYLLGWVL